MGVPKYLKKKKEPRLIDIPVQVIDTFFLGTIDI